MSVSQPRVLRYGFQIPGLFGLALTASTQGAYQAEGGRLMMILASLIFVVAGEVFPEVLD